MSMNINLSEETIKTIYFSLKSTKTDLKRQKKNEKESEVGLIDYKLEKIEDALFVFEEIMEYIYS